MDSATIRQTYLSYFEQNCHTRQQSGSLVPDSYDPSVLLTTAGMQPLKPYFLGAEQPPAPRLTSCQRCFRTTDIDQIGTTARHLTFFEMLGNFSFGDYFKDKAIAYGWELSTEGFGFDPELIWVTVFAGDDQLGLGPDDEAIELWRSQGVPEERIVRLPRAENFWQAGPVGPGGPCSEMYLDRGESFGGTDDRPGDDTDRFVEYWNHVFMALELGEDGRISELPKRNIDTGMGLERMAAILQGVDSVFDTDAFRPLISLCEELSGTNYGSSPEATRSMRIVADHSRGMVQLIADGVVPSNEDRGYILRRIMRRAIEHGRRIGIEGEFLGRFAGRAIELADVYPHLERERGTIERWVGAEEESFGRTLERGTALLDKVVAEAREAGAEEITAAAAFKLHDTYGFPFELTQELVGEQGLGVDAEQFAVLMEGQRERARAAGGRQAEAGGGVVAELIERAPPTEFVGYEQLETSTAVAAAAPIDGEVVVKLEASPFYAEGGGQVADSGTVTWDDHRAEVVGVTRAGDDQVVHIDGSAGPPPEGGRVECAVDRATRHATMRNHTATHLLHAALRKRLGTHVRQAGSAVRPDKLRFDFTHSEALSADDREAISARINGWIKASLPVRWLEMDRAHAEELGAMALFGEKYGDWVRVVEVEEVSRELCGGTHVSNTAEVGLFEIVAEGSSAANVRRIEAVTGPAAIDLFAERAELIRQAGETLGAGDDLLGSSRRIRERLDELEALAAQAERRRSESQLEDLAASAQEAGDVKYVVARAEGPAKLVLELAGRLKDKLGEDSAVVLATAEGGKVALAGVFGDGATGRGLSAAEVVGNAAQVVGGGGGGRANVAQAGGRDPEKLDEALAGVTRELLAGLGS